MFIFPRPVALDTFFGSHFSAIQSGVPTNDQALSLRNGFTAW